MARVRNPTLYAAVLAAPDDDAPRLVYADWLTERGDPWGELIALQIARTHTDTPELAARERELLVGVPPSQTYRRGFLEELGGPCDHLHRLIGDDSCVRELRAYGTPDSLVGTTLAALLPRMCLRSLATSAMTDAELATLLDALDDSLGAFEYAAFGTVPTTQVEAIVTSKLRISSLTLHGVAADAVALLAAWHPLRRLTLERSTVGRGGFAGFVDAPAFARLEQLALTNAGLGGEDVVAIATSAMPLVSLDLTGNPLGNGVAEQIASTPRFADLRALRLAYCEIGSPGLEALIASPSLSRELQLSIDVQAVGSEVVHGAIPGDVSFVSSNSEIERRLRDRFALCIG